MYIIIKKSKTDASRGLYNEDIVAIEKDVINARDFCFRNSGNVSNDLGPIYYEYKEIQSLKEYEINIKL